MIEIIESGTGNVLGTSHRWATILIGDGTTTWYWSVGNLPLEDDLQALLDAREAELWAAAQAAGRPVDIFGVSPKKIIKAVLLVALDEINLLRQQHSLAQRTAAQLEAAVKAKLKVMP